MNCTRDKRSVCTRVGSLFKTMSCSALPVALAVGGSVVAALRPVSGFVRSCIQHFAAGVVFAIAAGEILPDIVSRHLPAEIGIGFAAGVVTMLALRSLTRRLEKKHHGPSAPSTLLVPVAIDVAVDGLLLGIGFAAGARAGLLLSFAFAAEFASLGIAVAATLRKAGLSRLAAIAWVVLVILAFPITTGLGATVLRGLSKATMELVLAFGLAALLYLVTEELLVEAHEEPETSAFFAGFLIFVLIGMQM